MRTSGVAAANFQPGDPNALKKQQVWRTIEDHGLQYVSVVYNERGSEHGVAAFTAIVSDSYDNALAANVNVSYKNELIHTRRWNDAVEVEVATFEWVNWWNESRLHQSLGYRTSVEVEDTLWEQDESWKIIENRVNA
ncbi:integrase core domain-containing protein [Corynebacterium pseudodiphtheriticum]|uniref:integrase core domain-containing protein n=1 Tax=Corynebacterium pseudodiphtheriticum TaxID=37637 RepID=UPI000398A3B7|nr:integrase core domain-containing protein [Corynebacterium pseudodiphtheriticum]MDK4206652.1 integrase core domain-containing protein [Corynebacterium pseudodiphtheriticum]MDK4242139.1 integrase core domain-containing protein [Corynebacterium pseudodiphtheriticum]MDK4278197.1 integrase core domain-containing protein [Corynebacterium pseudodiphtheriticum]MDK4284422.1 integrase core domain-containing protein [Corynebacterium pseudodiphtheriticum]MDK4295858.1 integrase core domain-containing pr